LRDVYTNPPIFGPGLSNGVMKISPLTTSVAMATNRSSSKTKLSAAQHVLG